MPVYVALACVVLAPVTAAAGIPEDVDFTELKSQLGGSMPTGAGVLVSQVEASVTVNGVTTWMPDTGNSEFTGKAIINASGAPAGAYSGHATSVGQTFYGNTQSFAPGITNVKAYGASEWLGDDFLWTSGTRQPASTDSRVANHSWIADASSYNSEALRRLDWVIENDDYLNVVAPNNGSGPATQPLLFSSFNGIAIGRSDGLHGTGSFALDATYASGRTRPDLVIPGGSTSTAAPRVSATVALLVQTGHGNPALSTDPSGTSYTNRAGLLIRNAERAEVIKAILMAGADRVTRNSGTSNLALYRDAANQATNGLDKRYGAGQVNVRNSYRILAAGEKNSSEDGGVGSSDADRGFDYDPAFGGSSGSNAVGTYPLPVAATARLLTAALVWHLDINGGSSSVFNGSATLRDLSLSLVDIANPSAPVTIVISQSTVDNTENLYVVVPANAQYALRVTRGSGSSFKYDYGIAWQLEPDADADGAHDGQDNCVEVANGPLAPDAGGFSQRDTDDDGYGNVCDGDLDNSGGIVNFADLGLFRSDFGTSDPHSDLDGSGGIVNFADLGAFRNLFGQPPGPSAFAP